MGGRKTTATLTGVIMERSISKGCLQRDFFTPKLCGLVVDEFIEALMNGCYKMAYV
jgi:hypothetical protein